MKKIAGFFSWLGRELKDWSTYVLLAILLLILGLPVWGGFLLGLLFELDWAFDLAYSILGHSWVLVIYPIACIVLTFVLQGVLGKQIKRLFRFGIRKMIEFFTWIWHECKDWRTFVLLVIVCIVVGSPVWGCYLLYFLTHWGWTLAVATALLAFWWLPGAPYFAVCVAITLAIKRFFEKKQEKMEQNQQISESDQMDGETKESDN